MGSLSLSLSLSLFGDLSFAFPLFLDGSPYGGVCFTCVLTGQLGQLRREFFPFLRHDYVISLYDV